MSRIGAWMLVVLLGLFAAGCGSEEVSKDDGTTKPSAQEASYKCAGCGRTVALSTDAAPPSC